MKPAELLAKGAMFPARGYILKAGRKTVAFGGLAWRFNRCDIWLEVRRPELLPAPFLVRFARRMLRMAQQLGEAEVFCFRDEHPTSAKLLHLVGLRPYGMQEATFIDGRVETQELWRWVAIDGGP